MGLVTSSFPNTVRPQGLQANQLQSDTPFKPVLKPMGAPPAYSPSADSADSPDSPPPYSAPRVSGQRLFIGQQINRPFKKFSNAVKTQYYLFRLKKDLKQLDTLSNKAEKILPEQQGNTPAQPQNTGNDYDRAAYNNNIFFLTQSISKSKTSEELGEIAKNLNVTLQFLQTLLKETRRERVQGIEILPNAQKEFKGALKFLDDQIPDLNPRIETLAKIFEKGFNSIADGSISPRS